jgi:hypothetical protein
MEIAWRYVTFLLLAQVLQALEDNRAARNVELPLKLYTWSLPELVLTEPTFGAEAIDVLKAGLVPGKGEFVEPRLSTQEYFMRHSYFLALETLAGERTLLCTLPTLPT